MDYIPDVIVVGAGISGLVVAEQLASRADASVLILEKRDHIGGNCYDFQNEHGITVHKYGPHLFHTNKQRVWDYLSQFTAWHPYEHEVLTRVDGQLAPLPFNLNTLHKLFGAEYAHHLESKLLQNFEFGEKVSILNLKKHPDEQLQALGQYVYERLFVNYTTKQWGCAPTEIAKSVIERVPVVISRDNRYFHDRYQAIPKNGYTKMFESMVATPNIEMRIGNDANDAIDLDFKRKVIRFEGRVYSGLVIYTGMIDELCGFCLGELPYRSLQFEYETIKGHSNGFFYQPRTTVNYPNEELFTRITEFKHILPVSTPYSTIVREYPQDFDRNDPKKNVPYYPVLNEKNEKIYRQYAAQLAGFEQLTLLGRLAQYRYYNMDDAVDRALAEADRLVSKLFLRRSRSVHLGVGKVGI